MRIISTSHLYTIKDISCFVTFPFNFSFPLIFLYQPIQTITHVLGKIYTGTFLSKFIGSACIEDLNNIKELLIAQGLESKHATAEVMLTWIVELHTATQTAGN